MRICRNENLSIGNYELEFFRIGNYELEIELGITNWEFVELGRIVSNFLRITI